MITATQLPSIPEIRFADALDSGRYAEAGLRFPELFSPVPQCSIASMLHNGIRTHGERMVVSLAHERIFGLMEAAYLEYQTNLPAVFSFSNPQYCFEFVCIVPLPKRIYVTRYILPSDQKPDDNMDMKWLRLLLQTLNHPWEELFKSETRKLA